MEKTEDEKPGRLGSTASVRFKPHTEYLLDLKKDELGKSRSDTISYLHLHCAGKYPAPLIQYFLCHFF